MKREGERGRGRENGGKEKKLVEREERRKERSWERENEIKEKRNKRSKERSMFRDRVKARPWEARVGKQVVRPQGLCRSLET